MQLLLALAAYLLVTAVLKNTFNLSKSTCCILAVGMRLSDHACAAFLPILHALCRHGCADLSTLAVSLLCKPGIAHQERTVLRSCVQAPGMAQSLSACCSSEATSCRLHCLMTRGASKCQHEESTIMASAVYCRDSAPGVPSAVCALEHGWALGRAG